MSSFDGALVVLVDVEHLPGRRYRLSLGEPYPHADLREVDRTDQLWPEAQRRVGEHGGTVGAQGGVHVDANETGIGIYAPEEVTSLEENPVVPDELT